MTTITHSVRLIGAFEFHVGRHDLAETLSCRDQKLLAYLAWKLGQAVGRELVITDLWPELPPDRGMRALNTSLWRIRCALRKKGLRATNYLCTDSAAVALRADCGLSTDAAFIADQAALALSQGELESTGLLQSVQDGVSAYRGDFLPNWYDDWVHMPREILRNSYATLQEFLVLEFMKRKDWKQAITYAQTILQDEPTHETAHQWLINAHLALGDRMRAKVQYDRCAGLLRRELGVSPLPETSSLLDGLAPMPISGAASRAQRAREAIEKLDEAREAIFRLSAK